MEQIVKEALVALRKIMKKHDQEPRAKEIITYNFWRNKFPDEIADMAEEIYLTEEGNKIL